MDNHSQGPVTDKNSVAQDACNCCGTCCLKGGPAFHKQDKELLASGKIKMVDLYTIREGEPIYDNVLETISAAETDIIKIKGLGKSWSCRLLQQSDNSCTIYEKRPLECRVLKCWDTDEIEAVYNVDRLTRKDLLSGVEGLWDLIVEHRQKCSYERIKELIAAGNGNLEGEAKETVLEMIRYELTIRPMMAERGKLDPAMLDFLLGRPLLETITLFGLVVKKDGDDYIFQKKG